MTRLKLAIAVAVFLSACGSTQKGTSPSVAPSAIATAADTKVPDAGPDGSK